MTVAYAVSLIFVIFTDSDSDFYCIVETQSNKHTVQKGNSPSKKLQGKINKCML